MFKTIIAGFGPDDFSIDPEGIETREIKKKPEEILNLEKELKSILDELKIPKSEANEAYMTGMTEKGENKFSEAIYEALNKKQIAVNYIIDFIENYYEINDFIENDLKDAEYLSDNDKYIIKKFLLKKEIGELRFYNNIVDENKLNDLLKLKLKIISRMKISNNTEYHFIELKSFLDLYKGLKNDFKELGLVFEL